MMRSAECGRDSRWFAVVGVIASRLNLAECAADELMDGGEAMVESAAKERDGDDRSAGLKEGAELCDSERRHVSTPRELDLVRCE